MRSVLARTLHDLRGATVGWSLSIAAGACLLVYFFPTIQAFPHLEELMKALPPALQALAGGPEAVGTLSGFLRLKVVENLPLLFSIFAIMNAADAVAGEEERGTLELLLSHPVYRWEVALGKFAALGIALLVMALVVSTALAGAVRVLRLEADHQWIFASVIATVPVALLFGSVALLGSCGLRHARSAASGAGALLGLAYLLHLLAPLSPGLGRWAALSPVHAYLERVPWSGPVTVDVALAPLLLSALGVGLAVAALSRRDVQG